VEKKTGSDSELPVPGKRGAMGTAEIKIRSLLGLKILYKIRNGHPIKKDRVAKKKEK